MINDDERPGLTVVSQQSDADLARHEAEKAIQGAEQDLYWAVNEFSANLIRVIRGAGRVHEIPDQLEKLHKAIHDPAFDKNPWRMFYELENALRDGVPERYGRGDELDSAQHTMIRGALQMVASNFLDQNTQFAAGRSELFDGLREAEKVRERNRQEINRQRLPNLPDRVVGKKPAKRVSIADFMKKRAQQLGKGL